MRVIGGNYRGRRIKTIAGADVRPTSDRLRETLFNILAPAIQGARFLDLCAGSGAVGIEALSRGAETVTMVENSRRAVAVIQENLRTLGAAGEVCIIKRDAIAALKQLDEELRATAVIGVMPTVGDGLPKSSGGKFDLVFFDPPYASDLYARVMRQLASGDLLHEESIVIAEHHAKKPPERQYGDLRLYREVKQGESVLAFYRFADSEP